MDHPLIALMIGVCALLMLAIAAMRYGADSRMPQNDRPNW